MSGGNVFRRRDVECVEGKCLEGEGMLSVRRESV